MATTDLFKLPVTEISKKIKNGAVTSVELTTKTLEYAKKINDKTNAFISFREEEALKEAKKADEEIKKNGPRSLYHGIPMGIKDNIFLKDEITTMGSSIHREFRPDAHAGVIEKLHQAGAVLMGKLNLHEYAWGVTNYNPHFGPSRNPWNPEKITGGSSGGSAAAVASGASFASVGTDTAGSVRIPASCCGIVGLKPTQNSVSRSGVFPLSSTLDHVGPMGKTTADVAALFQILSAEEKTSAPLPEIKKYRVGIEESYYFDMLDRDVESVVSDGLKHLESLGVTLKPVRIQGLKLVPFIGYNTILSEAFALHKESLDTSIGSFGEDIRALYGMGIPNAVDYIRALELRQELKEEFRSVFAETDVLFTPSLPVLPPDIGSPTVLLNGEEADLNDHIMRFMFPGNITGLPSLSLPGGMAGGLPVGLQLIGPENGEQKILHLASALEARIGFEYSKAVDLVNK